jgi:hypothetical protein
VKIITELTHDVERKNRWRGKRNSEQERIQSTENVYWATMYNIQGVQPRRKPGRERGAGTTFLAYRCVNCR